MALSEHRLDITRRSRAKNRDRVNEQNRQYYQRNSERIHAGHMAWRAANREKRRAHRMVEYALAKGRLQKQPCACGNPQTQAHHSDYSKPLDVKWVCAKCHAKEHGRG